MKNLCKFVFVAAAAMALTFCSKDETVNPSSASGLKINVTAASTRTVFDTDNIKWSGSEEMTLYINGTKNTANAIADVNEESGAASFMFLTDISAPATLKLQGVVPASSVLGVKTSDKANNNAGVLQMELKSAQAATVASFDPAADILVSQDCDCEVTQDDVDNGIINAQFYFGRVMAITRYAVTNTRTDVSADEVVESVQVTLEVADDNAKKGLTGGFYFNLSKGRFVDNNGNPKDASTNPFYQNGGYNYVSIAYPEGSRPTLGELKIWTVTAPVTMEAGDKLVFTIKTDKNTITKTSTLKASISLDATRLNTSTVKIADNETCKVDPVETPSPDMQTATLTHDEIKKIYNGEIVPDSPSIISKGKYNDVSYTNTSGTWSGHVFISKSNNDYYWQINTSKESDANLLTPELSGNIVSIELELYQLSKNAVYLSTEKSMSTGVVATDDSGNRMSILFEDIDKVGEYSQLYIVGGAIGIKSIKIQYKESTDPTITVADADKTQNIPAGGDVVSVPFTAKNLAGDVTASCEAAWVNSIEVSGSEVTFAVDATDLTTERTAVLKIESATDGVSAEVTLVQAAAAPVIEAIAPDEYAAESEDTAVFEYSIGGTGAVEGAEVTAEVVYGDGEATGWITVIEVDNTDKAVWFEVAANDGGARTATIVLTYAKGETVYATVEVPVSQAKSAAVVDPAVSVDPAEWAPAAAGETKTFAVTLTDTDSYDVAKPDWITIEEQTATSLKLTAAANETGADRTGTVTLTVSNGKTATIAVTQAKQVTEKYYVKVTDAANITDGKYLIVFSDNNKAHATVSGKDLIASTDALTITDGKILSDAISDAGAVEISNKAIKLTDGTYLDHTSTSNDCTTSTTPVSLTFEYTNAGMKIKKDADYTLYRNPNKSGTIENPIYRFYKKSNSAYSLPDLYKLTEE